MSSHVKGIELARLVERVLDLRPSDQEYCTWMEADSAHELATRIAEQHGIELNDMQISELEQFDKRNRQPVPNRPLHSPGIGWHGDGRPVDIRLNQGGWG